MTAPPKPERDAVILSYVPGLVARFANAGDGLGTEPWAQRFAAALLFIDIAGFTPLTALLEGRGQHGVEELTLLMNTYWGAMIDLIVAQAGDVVKFAGDALLVVWPALDEDLATATARATQCGLAIANRFNDVPVLGDQRVSCRQAIVCGDVIAAGVGGLDHRWRFLMAGQPFAQLQSALATARPADVVLSALACAAVRDSVDGQLLRGGAMRVTGVRRQLAPPVSTKTKPATTVDTRLLRGYVPDPVLARLDADQAEWLAEFRRITVLFTKIIGANFEADDDLHDVHRACRALESVVSRYGGTVKELTVDEKGTTFVAVFGLPPTAQEDDPTRGVRAALAIQHELESIGLVGAVGIATGRVFCGAVGNTRRRDYALMGEAMPRAARFANGIQPGEVVCDEATFHAAQARVSFERLPPLVLKGIDHPVVAFRPFDAASVQAVRLVDRETERGRLRSALQAVLAGKGGGIVLEGEPGIGKTHLVEVLTAEATALGIRALTGTADAIERATSYYAWRSIFSELLGINPLDLRPGRLKITPAHIAVDVSVSHLVPLLNAVLPLDLPDNEISAQMTGQVRAANTQQLLLNVLRSAAAASPLTVILDDCQWLDSASWALARKVNEELHTVLLVLSTRPFPASLPDDYQALLQTSNTQRLQLDSLPAEDAITLFRGQLHVARISDELAAYVRTRAEGNPFYIEELARTLRDANFLEVVGGECRVARSAGDLESLNLPSAVQGMVTSRIDRLTQAEQLTLKVAAVIGRSFDYEVLRAIYPVEADREHLDEHLQALEQADLCRLVRSSPDRVYAFKHSITQQVAYELLPFAQRRQLHQQVAEWYERSHAANLNLFSPLIAENFRLAGQNTRALEYLERAGDQALQLFNNDDAIRFFGDALTLAEEVEPKPDRARRSHWELQLGQALVNLSRYDEGRQHLEAGLTLLDEPVPGNPIGRVLGLANQLMTQTMHALWSSHFVGRAAERRDVLLPASRAHEKLAEVYYFREQTVLALYAAFRTLNGAEVAGSSAELAEGYAVVGALTGLIPLHGLARRYLQRALEMAGREANLLARPFVWVAAGFYYAGTGDWSEAKRLFQDLVDLSARIGDQRRWQDGTWNLIGVHQFQGDFPATRTLVDEFCAAARRLGDPRFEAGSLLAAAHYHMRTAEYEQAGDFLEQAMARLHDHPAVNDLSFQLESFGLSAVLHLRRSDYEQALAAADKARDLARASRPSNWGSLPGYAGPAEVYLSLLESAYQRSDLDRLAHDACKLLGAYASIFPIGRPRRALATGLYHWHKGQHSRAEKDWRESLTAAESLAMRFDEALAHYELGRHLPEQDSQRVEHLEQAVSLFKSCGTPHHIDLAEQALAGGIRT